MMPTLWLKEPGMIVYAFDVDDTLEVSRNTVSKYLKSLKAPEKVCKPGSV